MGSAIPQVMLAKLLGALGMASETTLHDIRWGSEVQRHVLLGSGDLRRGAVRPSEAGSPGPPAIASRRCSSPMAARPLPVRGKAGRFIWARAHYEGTQVILHIGTGTAVELPA